MTAVIAATFFAADFVAHVGLVDISYRVQIGQAVARNELALP